MADKDEAEMMERSTEEEQEAGLEWLLRKDSFESTPVPMDTNVSRLFSSPVDSFYSNTFTRERIFKAASSGDAAQLHCLLDFLRLKKKTLTSPEFIDETNGKTALLKALLNLKDGKNDVVEVLLDIAEKMGDLEKLINASYCDPYYNGQTALHVAIERRSFEHVKLLVQKGADVQAKANGKFFQRKAELGFYFGELPLSLAACTNQPDIVSFLIENPHRRTDLTDKDSQGNTVLHTLVIIADDEIANTEIISEMYDHILIHHNKIDRTVQLEEIENNQGLTPLKLAAKLGKLELFKHMLHREFMDEETRPLSRKFTEWVYGPVHSSLYDLTSIDTNEKNSVLEIIVFGSETPNRPEMLQIEPLQSLLLNKWDRFASKLFLMNFLVYLIYLIIFTMVTFSRKDGQPPFPIDNIPMDYLRCVGELISVLGAVRILYKTIMLFHKNPPNFKALFIDGFSEILFFLQALLLLTCAVLYFCGRREYVGLLVLSLALAWINVLYYLRGSKQLGIYSVMMQRMILRDLLHFLCVYAVLLFGFSAAIVALMYDSPQDQNKQTDNSPPRGRSFGPEVFKCEKPSYNDIRFTTLELFKFTIGMGDLEFTDQVQYRTVFYILLITYIMLTYILMLNMLIALMGNTVERISTQSENIWNLQRAFTILDMERSLPRWLRKKLLSRMSKIICSRNETDKQRQFFRVVEMNWRRWRSDLGVTQEEEPKYGHMAPPSLNIHSRTGWNLGHLMERIRSRRRLLQPPSNA
ncbi:transient receptor potential cation channel subfamily V member 1-like isoform 2-T2 [Pholidichthys leucotaenia]